MTEKIEDNQKEQLNNVDNKSKDDCPKIVDNKEEKLQTSEYNKNIPTEDELKAVQDLQNIFQTHLSNNFSIERNDKINYTTPTGIDVLDVIMGGGCGTGLVQLVGPPGSGKSALAAKIIATGQRKYPGKFNAIYLDSEVATTEDRLAQLGVIYPRIKPYTNMTVEKVFQVVEGMCTLKEQHPEYMDIPWVIVWDSIANTITESVLSSNDPNSVMGQKARLLSHLLPKYAPKLNKYNISLVAINQLRKKIDIGIFKSAPDLRHLGDDIIPGGRAILYNSIQICFLKPKSDIKGEYGFLGIKCLARFIKNKMFSPFIDIDLIFSFERGFTNFFSNFELLKKTKRIQSGAWCKLKSCPEYSFRQNQAIEFYKTKPDFKKAFDDDVKDVLKTEYIDIYNSTKNDIVDF